jgi:hypothetical protein
VDGRCGNSFGLSDEAFQHFRGLSESTLERLPSTTVIDEILVLGAFTPLPNERCD